MSGRRTISEYTCKLCGRENQAPDNELPAGWLKFNTEHLYDERSFNTSYICDHCLTDLDRQRDYHAGVKMMKAVLAQIPQSTVERYLRGDLR